MRLKKTMSFIFWFLVAAAMVFVACCFFPLFNIGEIRVNGTESLSPTQVQEICGAKEGQNLIAFNTAAARKRLMANTYVKAVAFKKQLPNTLVINLEEYKVRGYIPYMNSYLYIDEEGRVLDSRPDMQKQLPIVTGLSFDGFTLGSVLKTDNPGAYRAVKEMATLFGTYELLGSVIKMDVSNMEDIHLYVDKLDVKFGPFEDANDKIAALNAILKETDTSVAGLLDLTTKVHTFRYLS